MSDFRHIDDFKTCRIPPQDVCIPGGGAIESYWKNSIATRCVPKIFADTGNGLYCVLTQYKP